VPDYEFLRQDETHRLVTKVYLDCNWLQALEGNIDPAHLSYLHRPVRPVDSRAVPGSTQSADTYYRDDTRPKLEYERTDFGLRIYSVRRSGEREKYVRITNFIMPNKAAIVGNEGRVGQGYQVNWHMPIDDTHHLRFDIAFNRDKPFNVETDLRKSMVDVSPDGRLLRNLGNRYLQDRAEMISKNYTGMGGNFLIHDAFAVESAGPIHDRSKEFLGFTDIIIVAARKQLLDAIASIERGKEPIHVIRDAGKNDMSHLVVRSQVVPMETDHRTLWKESAAISSS
jgi:phthalate 4,5-dioxygenase